MTAVDANRIAFFLRAFNDCDNITPAIYYFLTVRPEMVADIVVYSDDWRFESDANLAFLQNTFADRVRVMWLGDAIGLNRRMLTAGRIRRFADRVRGRLDPNHSVPRLCMGLRVDESVTLAAVRRTFGNGPVPALAVFDLNRTASVGGLVKALRAFGIPKVICLPVSPMGNINALRSTGYVTLDPKYHIRHADYSVFDRVAVVDPYYCQAVIRTFELLGLKSSLVDRTDVLGSIRFSPEWLTYRQARVKPYTRPGRNTKMVFFLSSPETNTFWAEVERTFTFLAEFEDISVVVKPHTRKMSYFGGKRFDNIVFDSDASSSSLIDWADAVMFWSSSIALEAYWKDKTALCLDYVNANRSVYAMLDAGWILRCRDDLHEALSALSADPSHRPYGKEGVERLLFQVVNGGTAGSLPDRYAAYLETHLGH
ncbi:hypothetical protein [Blastochloris sulfoviridis]|uniref:CDP-glycerol--glycerophosphate glycerophosphotransferase n=1 Tax=Blastochloris sulfoviridis TaxID=50712 RepID=A0A5M6HMR1_9HYPH|nr:hypothetical protein [Blastochloris sulfoviridis]KAA5597150.1 hypothetical protein F1193_15000 [Blastochloris sulfoviridis]